MDRYAAADCSGRSSDEGSNDAWLSEACTLASSSCRPGSGSAPATTSSPASNGSAGGAARPLSLSLPPPDSTSSTRALAAATSSASSSSPAAALVSAMASKPPVVPPGPMGAPPCSLAATFCGAALPPLRPAAATASDDADSLSLSSAGRDSRDTPRQSRAEGSIAAGSASALCISDPDVALASDSARDRPKGALRKSSPELPSCPPPRECRPLPANGPAPPGPPPPRSDGAAEATPGTLPNPLTWSPAGAPRCPAAAPEGSSATSSSSSPMTEERDSSDTCDADLWPGMRRHRSECRLAADCRASEAPPTDGVKAGWPPPNMPERFAAAVRCEGGWIDAESCARGLASCCSRCGPIASPRTPGPWMAPRPGKPGCSNSRCSVAECASL
mmetsp:Transcript_14270/g.54037  ORF Transcript_14270/g.54037 Transcript_14270/m.54037 type:complete len:389 (-) Transcript_14270:223-1389(-)